MPASRSNPVGARAPNRRHRCPVNGQSYGEVPASTILHHVRSPWAWQEQPQAYYFCEDPDCVVVYFGQDDSVIETSALRTAVGIKQRGAHDLVCYCFGVTFGEAEADPEIRRFVSRMTKAGACACAYRNPSGRCCLKDFPRH